MTFIRTLWTDRALPRLRADQLNRIEQGIADAHSGAAGTLTKIMDFALVGTTILRADNIPQTFNHLVVYYTMQSQRAATVHAGARFRINNDSTLVYDFNFNGFHVASGVQGADQAFVGGQSMGYLGELPGATRANDNAVLSGVLDIPFYRSGNVKHMTARASMSNDSSYTASIVVGNHYFPAAPAAITRLDLHDDAIGALGPRAVATLYGIV